MNFCVFFVTFKVIFFLGDVKHTLFLSEILTADNYLLAVLC